MKMFRIIMVLIVMFCAIGFVNGALTDNNEMYYKFDVSENPQTDSTGNGHTGAVTNAVYTTDGLINGSYDYDGAGDYITTTNHAYFAANDSFSFNGWFNTSSSSQQMIQIHWSSASNHLRHFLRMETTGVLTLYFGGGTAATSGTYNDGNWHMYTFIYDGGTASELYIDGVSVINRTIAAISTVPDRHFFIGSNEGASMYYDGQVDEVSLWSRILSPTEISDLYNGGSGNQYPYASGPAPPSVQNITTNLKSFYNTSNISIQMNTTINANLSYNISWNESIDNPTKFLGFAYPIRNNSLSMNQYCLENTGINGGISLTNNPASGTIVAYWNGATWLSSASLTYTTKILCTDNVSIGNNINTSTFNIPNLVDGSYNITFVADNSSLTTLDGNFTVDITPPNITNNVPTNISNYYINGSWFSCTDTYLEYCNISINGFNKAQGIDFNITNNGNITYNISAKDTAGNLVISNGTIFVNPIIFFSFNDSGTILNTFTFGNRSSIGNYTNFTVYNDGLIIGNNTLTFIKAGYETENFKFEINTSTPQYFTFNVAEAEINIDIRDQLTGSIVTGELFNLEFIGPVGLETNTTTGQKDVTGLLIAGDYRLIVTSENYTTENNLFTFSGAAAINLTVYVVSNNASKLGFVEIEVLDSNGAPVENAIARAKQWDTATSSYITVSEDKTAQDGKANVNIILDDRIYKFSAEFGSFVSETIEQIITTANNGRTITITLLLEAESDVSYPYENVITNVTESFNDVTNVSTVTFYWENTLGTDITGCVNAYRIQNFKEVLIAQNCTTSSSATKIKQYTLDLKNYNYVVKAEILQDGYYDVVKVFKYNSSSNIFYLLKEYNLHYFLYMLIVILSVFAGIQLTPFIGGLGLIIGAIALVTIEPLIFTASVAGLITLVGGLIVWGATR